MMGWALEMIQKSRYKCGDSENMGINLITTRCEEQQARKPVAHSTNEKTAKYARVWGLGPSYGRLRSYGFNNKLQSNKITVYIKKKFAFTNVLHEHDTIVSEKEFRIFCQKIP